MATFARRRKPPDGKPYASYRDCLRLDFSFRCAHCLIDEADYQGPDSFEVDHFQPKSRFPSLERTYANLHYCCLLCNRKKSDRWPSPEEEAKGERFVDPCAEDWEKHVEFQEDGSVRPLTPAGEYSVRAIRLDRDQLRRHRRDRPGEYSNRAALRQVRSKLKAVLAAARNRRDLPDEVRQQVRQEIAALRTEILARREAVSGAWNGKERMPPEPRCPY